MRVQQTLFGLAVAVVGAVSGSAQTQVDLHAQARNVDFSSANSTKPIKTGAALPVVCAPGEAFFLTSAIPGQNLNFCSATNSWAVQGSAGPAGPMGPPGMSWRGTWSVSATYAANDVVEFNGSAYIAILGGAGQQPDSSPGSWSVLTQGGATGATGATGMPGAVVGVGPAVTNSGLATLTEGVNCSAAVPCQARIGGVVFTYVASATISLSGGSPVVRIYISDGSDGAPAGTVKVRNSAATGVTCSAGCVVENSQISFPGMSIPLALWTATIPGVWDSAGQDLRSVLVTSPAATAGAGIVVTQGLSPIVSVDTTVVPRKFGGSGPPGNIASSTLGDFYIDTLNNNTYQCFNSGPCVADGPGNWIQVVSSPGSTIDTSVVPRKFSGPGVPASVAGSVLGDFYLDITNNDTYQCFNAGPCSAIAPGNWVKVDSGGSTGGPATPNIAYLTYNGTNYFPLYTSSGLPDAATWSWFNQPTGATVTTTGGHARHLFAPPPGSNGDVLTAQKDGGSLSSTSFTLRATLQGCVIETANGYGGCGIGITDGAKSITIGFGGYTNQGTPGLNIAHWTNSTSTPAPAFYLGNISAQWPTISYKIVLAGATLTFFTSTDGGNSWDPVTNGVPYAEPITAFFSSATGLSGFWWVDASWNQAGNSATLLDWSH